MNKNQWINEKQRKNAYEKLVKTYGEKKIKEMSLYELNTAIYYTYGKYQKNYNFVMKGEN